MSSAKSLIKRKQVTKIKFVSLFCGAGGFDLGFYKAGFDPLVSVDSNADAIETYKNLFPNHETYLEDLGTFKITKKADLVIGGPPCQGFSVAGYANPEDPRSKHVFNFMTHVKNINPKVFVMENVKALASSDKWEDNRKVLIQKAHAMGYDAKFFILNAADFGVPQSRERMFFIGVKGKNELDFSSAKISKRKTIRDVLQKLPCYGEPGNNTFCTAKIVVAKKPVLRGNPYSGMFFNGKGRILNIDRPSLTLPASMGGNHTPIIDQLNLEESKLNWANICYKKLIEGQDIKRLPSRLRRLTVEEAAAIQSFPKNMKFFGNVNSRFRQIGNAVPPRLSFYVAKHIRDQFFQ